MKNYIPNFEEFLNESKLNEKVLNPSQLIKELTNAGRGAQSYIEEKENDGDKEIANTVKQICDFFGELPINVIGIDQYTEDSDDLIETYDKISSSFRGQSLKSNKIGGNDDVISFDASKNIVMMGNRIDDFVIYWFTKKSKF
jgi:hypothetical protein